MSGGQARVAKVDAALNLYICERLGDCVRAYKWLEEQEGPLPMALVSYKHAVRQAVSMALADDFFVHLEAEGETPPEAA